MNFKQYLTEEKDLSSIIKMWMKWNGDIRCDVGFSDGISYKPIVSYIKCSLSSLSDGFTIHTKKISGDIHFEKLYIDKYKSDIKIQFDEIKYQNIRNPATKVEIKLKDGYVINLVKPGKRKESFAGRAEAKRTKQMLGL